MKNRLAPDVKSSTAIRVLIVEDDDLIRQALVDVLSDWGAEVLEASSESEAMGLLELSPAIVVVDIRLGADGGSGVRVAENAAMRRPCPRMLAVSGSATCAEAFRLAQIGVGGFVTKPLDIDTFMAAFEAMLERTPSIDAQVAQHVGSTSYPDLLDRVRRTMVEQALSRTSGNREHAAQLLKVTRQAVQQMIKGMDVTPRQADHLSYSNMKLAR